eukprot:PhF_6_TR30145/c0_g1_i2/m.44120
MNKTFIVRPRNNSEKDSSAGDSTSGGKTENMGAVDFPVLTNSISIRLGQGVLHQRVIYSKGIENSDNVSLCFAKSDSGGLRMKENFPITDIVSIRTTPNHVGGVLIETTSQGIVEVRCSGGKADRTTLLKWLQGLVPVVDATLSLVDTETRGPGGKNREGGQLAILPGGTEESVFYLESKKWKLRELEACRMADGSGFLKVVKKDTKGTVIKLKVELKDVASVEPEFVSPQQGLTLEGKSVMGAVGFRIVCKDSSVHTFAALDESRRNAWVTWIESYAIKSNEEQIRKDKEIHETAHVREWVQSVKASVLEKKAMKEKLKKQQQQQQQQPAATVSILQSLGSILGTSHKEGDSKNSTTTPHHAETFDNVDLLDTVFVEGRRQSRTEDNPPTPIRIPTPHEMPGHLLHPPTPPPIPPYSTIMEEFPEDLIIEDPSRNLHQPVARKDTGTSPIDELLAPLPLNRSMSTRYASQATGGLGSTLRQSGTGQYASFHLAGTASNINYFSDAPGGIDFAETVVMTPKPSMRLFAPSSPIKTKSNLGPLHHNLHHNGESMAPALAVVRLQQLGRGYIIRRYFDVMCLELRRTYEEAKADATMNVLRDQRDRAIGMEKHKIHPEAVALRHQKIQDRKKLEAAKEDKIVQMCLQNNKEKMLRKKKSREDEVKEQQKQAAILKDQWVSEHMKVMIHRREEYDRLKDSLQQHRSKVATGSLPRSPPPRIPTMAHMTVLKSPSPQGPESAIQNNLTPTSIRKPSVRKQEKDGLPSPPVLTPEAFRNYVNIVGL